MLDVDIRPMREDDVRAANAVAARVLYPPEDGAANLPRRLARILHLLETDPGGSWVAERDGAVVGVALALLREGLWGFSLFAVDEQLQGRGIGRALFERCLAYGEGARGRLVLSSTSPAAMRRYVRAGLRLRPCVAAAGIPDLSRAPEADGVVDAGPDGIAIADAIGRDVRGAGHGRDLHVPLAHGARLLVFEDRGFAVAAEGKVVLLAARDEEAARRLLWGAFTSARPGTTAIVDFLTAGQDWAIQVCVDAGLALSPDGPMFTAGELGPLAPYVPSGPYL